MLNARNETLNAEVLDLKSGRAAVEQRARSELGMIKQDEVFYQVIDQSATSSNTSTASNTKPTEKKKQWWVFISLNRVGKRFYC